ncbi:winged helix-turn-helix domain-containing protein [Lentisalinibacter salinarum]|uniref:winged helix-turn-helix domain-containing protein n=1 Tax=Lentisalinibacter salinarum TaxID=2992239 RepID=UPI00386B90CE
MVCRFGQFELDEDLRELRLNGEEVPLQPRVFDLLALLCRNRDRVMGKDELMDALWPNVVVGDGSLQRAVSLARSALKRGGLGSAIRNYARQGYRLCLDEESEDASDEQDSLALARASFERRDWDGAVAAYQKADEERALDARDLERLADALQCSGCAEESVAALERAVAAWSATGECTSAARVALRLAELSFEAARIPVAQGWLTRGRRYLEGCEEGPEHGFEAYISARIAVGTGDPAAAVAHARRGMEIARRLGSEEIEALALVFLGYGEIALGDVEVGMQHVDEAAAAVLSGRVGRHAGGVVYCGLIWVCCNRGDWERAAQWSETFSRWCQREGMTRFSGLCQLHRAEVLSVSGEAAEAERELHIACDQLASFSPFAAGDAYRILGDLHLMRGDLEEAENAFRRAHDLGWEPQPGLALLQAERGDAGTALRGLRRSLEDRNWSMRQRRGLLLAVFVIIAAQHGDEDAARWAMEELEQHPELWVTAFHNGAVARARAELAALGGDTGRAVAEMRDAVRCWQAARAGLNLATCRLRLARLLAASGDAAGARLELEAAESCFREFRAPARAAECAVLRKSLA